MNTYQQAEQYILSIPKFAGKHTLEDTGRWLHAMTDGACSSKIVHVAGTNGKGSVCAYLQSILMEAGYRVGLFISPHLETMRERISINGELISEKDFVRHFEKLKAYADRDENEAGHPSFFEFLFLMAMSYFDEQCPDYVILETGLGGRLDATNCIKKPQLCVITEIGFDHMQYLGNTLEEIAGEKAGIIKPQVPLVYLDKRPQTSRVLEEAASEKKAETVPVEKSQIQNVTMRKKTIDFSFFSSYYNYNGLVLHTVALYQTENAALAIAAAKELQDDRITEEAVRKGLCNAFWPGRMEEILPNVYLDGAHNEDGIEAFLETVRQQKRGRNFLLFGVVADKQYHKMIAQIAGAELFEHIAVTVLESERSAAIDKLKVDWEQYKNVNCSFHKCAEEAFCYLASMQNATDTIYIAGSLYLVGQIKTLVRRTSDDRL